MSISGDCMAGLKTKWDATAGINSVIPTARLYSDGDFPGQPTRPYAVFTVMKERDNEFQSAVTSGNVFIAYRRFIFHVYDSSKTGVATAVNAIATGLSGGFTIGSSSNRLMSWAPEDDEVEITAVDGETEYMGRVEFVAELQRAVP